MKSLNIFIDTKRLERTQSFWSRHAYKMWNGKYQQTHPLHGYPKNLFSKNDENEIAPPSKK